MNKYKKIIKIHDIMKRLNNRICDIEINIYIDHNNYIIFKHELNCIEKAMNKLYKAFNDTLGY
jgi:hypothetical protein